MGHLVTKKIEAWAGSQSLAALSRIVTLLLVPLLLAAGPRLLTVSEQVTILTHARTENERRLASVEADQRRADGGVALPRIELAALVAEQRGMRR